MAPKSNLFVKYSTCGQQCDCDHCQTDGQIFADNDDDSSIILLVNIHHAATLLRNLFQIHMVLALNASSYCSFFYMQLATVLHFFAVLPHIATSEVMPFNLRLKPEAAWLHLIPILSSRSTSDALKTAIPNVTVPTKMCYTWIVLIKGAE